MINIGLDTKGSDNGASFFVEAVFELLKVKDNITFTFYGIENDLKEFIESELKKQKLDESFIKNRVIIVDSPETIEMNDHPVFAIRSKKNSSITLAANDLKEDKIDCLISAGSTGALLAVSLFYVKTIEGIERPVVGTMIPTNKGKTLLLDMGANMDPKPEWLYQYALIGKAYFSNLFKESNPSIGLLSVGVEENKGNNLINDTYKLLKQDSNLNFIGNVEARDVPFGSCDILICDGFSGNVLLKTYEGTSKMLLNIIKSTLKASIITSLGALLILPKLKGTMKKFDAKTYGGAPYLGCNKLIIKCHGNSKKEEIRNAIYQAIDYMENNTLEKIKESVSKNIK